MAAPTPGKKKRVGILGAGAIGSVVGGMLARDGHDVTIIDPWFEHIDANGSGELDRDEVATLYRQAHGVNLKPKLLDDAMKMMDLDGSGSVEFEEFAVCEFRTARTPSGAASFLPMRCVSVRVRVVET